MGLRASGRPVRVIPRLMRIGRRIRARIFGREPDEEVDEELAFHLEMRIREHVARGAAPEEARKAALGGFGDFEAVRRICRRLGRQREGRTMWRTRWEELVQDVVFGARHLRKSPATTAVAVLTLGVGMGATTAVFGAVDGVLLTPLPYAEPDRLVHVWTRYLPPSGFDIPRFEISGPEILDYREQNDVFASLGYYALGNRDLTGEGLEPQRVQTAFVSVDVLPTLGVAPALGRWIRPEEDRPGGGDVVLLTHDLWVSRFGADRTIVGRTIEVSGRSALVAGVMPEGFAFPDARYQLIENLGLDEAAPGNRGGHGLVGIGRLKPGATLEHVRAEAEAIHAGWAEKFPHNVAHFPIFHRLADDVIGADVRQVLLVLLGAGGLVLLIAAVNVANLLLARGEARSSEVAVRRALGAGRGRIVRQLLTESLVLAALGALVGLALASWGTAALLRIDPTALPRADQIAVDAGVVAFAALAAAATAVLFGLAPALQAGGSPAVHLGSGERGGTGSGRRRRFRRALVAAEVALSVVVVTAAGLVVRSYRELTAVDPGVRLEGVLTFTVALPAARYPDAPSVAATFQTLQERLAALPGVRSAAAVSRLPLSGSSGRADFRIEGRDVPQDGARMWNAEWSAVLPGYFETAGVEILSGRGIGAADAADTELVAVIGEETARLFFQGEDPIGARISAPGSDTTWARVVGIARGTRTASLEGEIWPQVYHPHAQGDAFWGQIPRTLSFVLHAGVEPARSIGSVRAAVAELDPALPLAQVRTMEDAFGTMVARPRLLTHLLGAFAITALALAVVGIYGVVSYAVARRTREIGIRMALGEGRPRVVARMVLEGTTPALIGVAAGMALALGSAGLVSSLLFGVSPRDPLTLVAIPTFLAVVAVVSSWIPARRAARMAPTRALRDV